MKNFLLLLFIARVLIPMHVTEYNNVTSWTQLSDQVYVLTLADGRKVVAPVMWTVIEEKK